MRTVANGSARHRPSVRPAQRARGRSVERRRSAAAEAPARSLQGAALIWPLTVICLGMPVLYLLGAGALVWSLPCVVLGLDLLRRRNVVLPKGSGFLLALLAWIVLSGVQLRSVPALGLAGYRLTIFGSLAALYIWICNIDRRAVPTRTIIELLAALWIVLVVFGYLAILNPDLVLPSPVQMVLPGALAADSYVQDLTNIRFAETQGFLGYEVPRPSAPMAFSNGWGSTLGLLTPFFVLSWVINAPPRRRWAGRLLLLAGLVPAIVSLNRGLWLSTALMLAFVAGRSFVSGNRRLARNVVIGAAVIGMVVLLSPLEALISDKVSGADDGDATRGSVYEGAIEFTLKSPIAGYGAPVAQDNLAVTIGTHGLIWYLLVSHGVPAATFFLLWLAGVVARGLTLRSTTGIWAASAATVCLFQMPIYGLLPQLALAGVIGAVIWREREVAPSGAARTRRPQTVTRS